MTSVSRPIISFLCLWLHSYIYRRKSVYIKINVYMFISLDVDVCRYISYMTYISRHRIYIMHYTIEYISIIYIAIRINTYSNISIYIYSKPDDGNSKL